MGATVSELLDLISTPQSLLELMTLREKDGCFNNSAINPHLNAIRAHLE